MTTSEKTCFKCKKTKQLSDFYRHKAMADGHLNKCKCCTKSDANEYRLENIEKIKEYDRQRGCLPHRVSARLKYQQTDAYRESSRKSYKRHGHKNKEARRVIKLVCETRRRAAKINRTPPWINSEQKEMIKTKYKEAKWMTQRTGIKHHVDHIVPLLGVDVCGLHVPWNLRVLPARENARKGNKLEIARFK